MSTRSTTHFIETDPETGKVYTAAIVYRHPDGYPKGAGVDLCKFITKCKALRDSRLSDPSYLAAKYVVFLSEIFAADGMFQSPDGKLHKHIPLGITDNDKWKYVRVPRKNRLDFISVGVVAQDPPDIEYRYTVDCGKIDPDTKRPEVKCFKVHSHRVPGTQDDWTYSYEEVAIPGRTKAPAPVKDEFINEHIVHSHTEAGVSYEVKQNRTTLAWTCSCPCFKYRKHCKHTPVFATRPRTMSASW
jgi:hypothetical protein